MINTYRVEVEPERGWWRIAVPQVGIVSRTRAPDRIADLARDLIATVLRVPADSFDLELDVVEYASAWS